MEYYPERLGHLFLSHQQVMIETMRANGSNNFKRPHMKKEKLAREGKLTTSLKAPLNVVAPTIEMLKRLKTE